MNNVPYTDYIPEALRIVRAAGDVLLEIYNGERSLDVETKSDNSPVTIADFKSNEVLIGGLKKVNGSIPIISEESARIPYEERKEYEYFWIIDPLDGTREFVQHLDEFTIHLALVKGNKPVFGIIYAPVFDDMYYAWENGGAWREFEGEKTRLQGHKVDLSDSGLRIVRSRSNLDPKTQEAIDGFDNPRPYILGSGLKFMKLITGDADYYPRVRTNMKEWDVAPASVILEEAGGGLFDWGTKTPLLYNKKELTVKGFEAVSLVE